MNPKIPFYILVVDDEIEELHRLRILLEAFSKYAGSPLLERDVRIETASNAKIAINMIKRKSYDIVLADVVDSANRNCQISTEVADFVRSTNRTPVLVETTGNPSIGRGTGRGSAIKSLVYANKPGSDNISRLAFFGNLMRAVHLANSKSFCHERYLGGHSAPIQKFNARLQTLREKDSIVEPDGEVRNKFLVLNARPGMSREVFECASNLRLGKGELVFRTVIGNSSEDVAIEQLIGASRNGTFFARDAGSHLIEMQTQDLRSYERLGQFISNLISNRWRIGRDGFRSDKEVRGRVIIARMQDQIAEENIPAVWNRIFEECTHKVAVPSLEDRPEDLPFLFNRFVFGLRDGENLRSGYLSEDCAKWLESKDWKNDGNDFWKFCGDFGITVGAFIQREEVSVELLEEVYAVLCGEEPSVSYGGSGGHNSVEFVLEPRGKKIRFQCNRLTNESSTEPFGDPITVTRDLAALIYALMMFQYRNGRCGLTATEVACVLNDLKSDIDPALKDLLEDFFSSEKNVSAYRQAIKNTDGVDREPWKSILHDLRIPSTSKGGKTTYRYGLHAENFTYRIAEKRDSK